MLKRFSGGWAVRIGLGIFLVLRIIQAASAAAQEFWFSGVDAGSSVVLDLYSGPVAVRISPVVTSTRLSVLVHLDSLTPDEWELTQGRIRNLINATRQSGGIDLYVITDTGTQSWMQVKSVSQIQDLRKLSPAARPSNESAWSEIVEGLPEAAEHFQSLIIFASPGDLQNVDLKLYASAYFTYRARTKQLRVFHWRTTEGQGSTMWKTFGDFTCGGELPRDFDPKSLSWTANACNVVSYTSPDVSAGVFSHVGLLRSAGSTQEIAKVPLLTAGTNWQPISITRYMELLRAFSDAESALKAADATRLQTSLQNALQINPIYPPALRFGADLYKRQGSWETALSLLTTLSEVLPSDPQVWSDIGEMNFNLQRWSPSGTAYARTNELSPRRPDILERLSLIRENLNDPDGAEKYLAQVIAIMPDRIDFHVKRGDLLTRLNRREEALAEFESALKLNPELDDLRMRAISTYLDANRTDDVRRHLRDRMKTVRSDAVLRTQYAEFAVRGGLFDEALAYFDRAIEASPGHEPAHFGKATIFVQSNKKQDALRALDEGIRSAPSVRLRLMKFDLLDEPASRLESRLTIEEAAGSAATDVGVLNRYARVMDVYGNNAGAAYYRLAQALRSSNAPLEQVNQVLQRGLDVAQRDSETQALAQIRQSLESVDPHVQSSTSRTEGTTILPGGIGGIAAAAGIRPDVAAQSFVLQYAEALLRQGQGPKPLFQNFVDLSHMYFDTLEKLQKRMVVSQQGLDVVLDTSRQGYDKTEEILRLLGWKINRGRDRIVLEVGTAPEDAKRQLFSSGFGIDLLALKQAVENGRPFSLHIPYETVPIAVDETFWIEKVMNEKRSPGGLVAALVDHLPAVRLYVAMANISAETRQQLIRNISPEKLARRYSELLTLYGSSLSVTANQVAVPGDNTALAAWEKLVGVSPMRSDAFLNALLEKDSGKALAYFHTLFNLPIENQRFFTRTPQRLSAFYRVFPFSEKDVLEQHQIIRRNTHFFDLMRELPLGTDGNIVFPGSDQIWMVARGSSNSDQIGKLLKRARKALAPDMEDEILLKMLDKNYDVDGISHNESENFLAVVRMDKHRPEAMDETSALILTQNYPRYNSLFPYLSSLPSLTSDQLTKFFKAAKAIEALNDKLIETATGDFHGLVSLLTMLVESRSIKDADAAAALSSFCDAVPTARERRDFTRITFDALQQLLSFVSSPGSIVDEKLLAALSGDSSAISFDFGGSTWTVNRAERQQKSIAGALKAQTATPLQVLLDVYSSAHRLEKEAPTPEQYIRILEEDSAKLLEVTPRPEDHLTDNDKERLIQGKPKEIAELVAKLKKESVKRNNAKSIANIAQDYIDELTPYLKVSLTAWTYGYYASPDDLIMAEDRYFVRRHIFYSRLDKKVWRDTDVQNTKANSGIDLTGGLAQIAIAAGQWGQNKIDSSRSINADGQYGLAARAQLAAFRAIPWKNISSDAIHLAALELRTGKEIIVQSGKNEELRRAVTEHLMGLVGNFRRIAISQALNAGDPMTALEQLSASDLYFLVEALKLDLPRLNVAGPVVRDYLAQQKNPDWSQVRYLGGFHPSLYGCVHPHLVRLAPYEEFEHLLFGTPMSERLSDIVLSISESADQHAFPSDAVALLGEPVLRQLAASTKMIDRDDWMSAIQAMNRIDVSKDLSQLEAGTLK